MALRYLWYKGTKKTIIWSDIKRKSTKTWELLKGKDKSNYFTTSITVKYFWFQRQGWHADMIHLGSRNKLKAQQELQNEGRNLPWLIICNWKSKKNDFRPWERWNIYTESKLFTRMYVQINFGAENFRWNACTYHHNIAYKRQIPC